MLEWSVRHQRILMPERRFKFAFACKPDRDNCIIRSRQVSEPPRIVRERLEQTKRNLGISRRRFIGRGFKATAAGLLIPEIAKGITGTTVITNSSGIVLEGMYNEIAVSRPFLNLGGNFSVLRIGIRCMVNGASVAGSPSFYIGAQSGTTKQPFDASWVNCFIADQIGGSWTTAGSGTSLRFEPLSFHITTLVGVSFTDSTVFGSTISISARSHSGSPCVMMAELRPGSPKWTLNIFTPLAAGANTALSQSDFYAQMVATTPTWTGYGYPNSISGGNTLTFSQVAGTIDTACYGWLNTTPLEVTDFAVTYSP